MGSILDAFWYKLELLLEHLLSFTYGRSAYEQFFFIGMQWFENPIHLSACRGQVKTNSNFDT